MVIGFLPGLYEGREASEKISAREREVRRKNPLLVLFPNGTNKKEVLGLYP